MSSPHFPSGIVERAKRECAWKLPHVRKGDTRQGERKTHFSLFPPSVSYSRVGWFSRALVYCSLYYPWGKMGNTRSLRSSTRVVCVNGKHPWILDPTFRIPDSRYWFLDSLLVERGFRIVIVSGIPLPLSWISDSKALESGFHRWKFPGFRIRTARHFRTSWFGKKTLKEAL